MSIFGTLPIHFQYAIVIGAPVVSLLVGAVLAFFLMRRRFKKRERELKLHVLDESAYHQSTPPTAGAFAASALVASRLSQSSRDPTVPFLDEEAAYPKTHSKELRSSSRADNWSLRSTSATLPPYGPYSPPFIDHDVRGGIRDHDETSKWSSDAAYSMAAPPRAPPAVVHRDRAIWTPEEATYPDVAPPPFESRPGSTRSQAGARHASPVTYRSESRPPLSRPATALSNSRVPRQSPPPSRDPTPHLMQRPGTADGRVGHEPGRTVSAFTSVQRPSTAQGQVRSDPRTRWPSATRTPTPHSARAGPSQRSRSSSAPFGPPDGRSRPRRPTLAPLQPQRRGDVSPPFLSSSSREMLLLPQEHQSIAQGFTVADALRRPLTPEERAEFKQYHVAAERADVVIMSEGRWIQARRTADAEADPSPRSRSPEEWAGTPSPRDRWGTDTDERPEDVPLVLRPGYSPLT